MFRIEIDNFRRLVYAGEESARIDKLMTLNLKFVDKNEENTDDKGEKGTNKEKSEKRRDTASEKNRRRRFIYTSQRLVALKASLDVYHQVMQFEFELEIEISNQI